MTKAAAGAKATTKGTMTTLMERVSGKLSEGQGKKIRRREATFTIKKELCEPDAFENDIEVFISGLSSKEEEEALGSAGNGASSVFAMAKASIRTVDGEPVRREARNVLWDVLGFAGRTVVVNHFAQHVLGVGNEEDGDGPLSASLGGTEVS